MSPRHRPPRPINAMEYEPQTGPPIEIDGAGIILRQLVPEDDQALFEVVDADRVHLSQTYGDYRDTTADNIPDVAAARQMIEHPRRQNMLAFGIWVGDTMVGYAELALKTYNTAIIGYWIGGEHTRQGYALHALEQLSSYGLNEMGYEAIYGLVLEDNKVSQHTMLKAGYSCIKTFETPKGMAVEFKLSKTDT